MYTENISGGNVTNQGRTGIVSLLLGYAVRHPAARGPGMFSVYIRILP